MTELVAGEGLRGLLVGRATVEDVERELGHGERVAYEDGDVFQLKYGSGDPGRPHHLDFDHGMLQAITVSATQTEFVTAGGLRIRSSRAEVIAALGEPDQILTDDTVDTLRYLDRGLELGVANDDDFGVLVITVFRARR